jgi:glucose/arabinose dehydrogenase
MRARLASCAAAAIVAMAALPACGDAQEPSDQQRRTDAGIDEPAAASAKVGLKRIGSFDAPVYVAGAPGFPQLLFVVEQQGTVRVLRDGKRLRRPFLDISGLVGYGGERGLLSIAFPPDYAASRRFYVYFTDEQGDIRVDEFKRRSVAGARAAR